MSTGFTKSRLEAFSDGVIAIIITIMVLELKVPSTGGSLADLQPLWPMFFSYVMSFIYVGIYWNNHHHLLQATQQVNGCILLANLHLLFWLSLVPFVTAWMGVNPFCPIPTALYGVVMFLSGIAYLTLQSTIVCVHGNESVLARAVGRDWKGKLSLAQYLLAIGLSFFVPWLAVVLYAVVAGMWIVPDSRIESALGTSSESAADTQV